MQLNDYAIRQASGIISLTFVWKQSGGINKWVIENHYGGFYSKSLLLSENNDKSGEIFIFHALLRWKRSETGQNAHFGVTKYL